MDMDKYEVFALLNNFDNLTIGTEIKNARKNKKLTREQLAELIDIDAKQIYRIETGQTSPKLENFLKIAKVLELQIDYFKEYNIPQNAHTKDFLEILKNSSDEELTLYLSIIKSIKNYCE